MAAVTGSELGAGDKVITKRPMLALPAGTQGLTGEICNYHA
jgi:hypothetical protein